MLDRTPLRLKLVAAILLLVTFALLVIGAASVFVVRGYLVDRMDEELRTAAYTVNQREFEADYPAGLVVPAEYIRFTTPNGVGPAPHRDSRLGNGDLPRRVPDYEPGDRPPHTEVGRLSRALNTMLGQIETAFLAREASERAALESQARALRSEERMRQFVADASHELRTPLTSIRGFAELYRQIAEKDPAQAAKLVGRIEQEAARMGLLVEDLLLLARLDQERPLEPVELELRVIVGDAVIAARAVAPGRGISLEIPDGTGPVRGLADESPLRQVGGNLMSNALTHTPAGTPIRLRLRRDRGQAVIEVADKGPGLTAEQVERVFERFYRADTARTRHSGDSGGAGLGLAIVAALVKAHAGTVEVESVPGKGATFRVRLPIHS